MFVCAVRMSKKQILSLAVCAVMLVAIGVMMAAAPANTTADGSSETARIQYLQSLGYAIEPGSGRVETVCLPEDFDEVFTAYNALQKEAGQELLPYRGQVVERWSYPVENYPAEGGVTAHLLVRGGKIIGGDIAADASGGFQHGLMPIKE